MVCEFVARKWRRTCLLSRCETVILLLVVICFSFVNIFAFLHFSHSHEEAQQHLSSSDYIAELSQSHPMRLFMVDVGTFPQAGWPQRMPQFSGVGFLLKGRYRDQYYNRDQYYKAVIVPKISQWQYLASGHSQYNWETAESYVIDVPVTFRLDAENQFLSRKSTKINKEALDNCTWASSGPWFSAGRSCHMPPADFSGSLLNVTIDDITWSDPLLFRVNLSFCNATNYTEKCVADSLFYPYPRYSPKWLVMPLQPGEEPPNLTSCAISAMGSNEYDLECVYSIMQVGVGAKPGSTITVSTAMTETEVETLFHGTVVQKSNVQFTIDRKDPDFVRGPETNFGGFSPSGWSPLPEGSNVTLTTILSERRTRRTCTYTFAMLISNMLAVFNFSVMVTFWLFKNRPQWPYFFAYGASATRFSCTTNPRLAELVAEEYPSGDTPFVEQTA